MRHSIDVQLESETILYRRATRLIKKALPVALRARGVNLPCQIDVLLTDNEGIRVINLDRRGVDKVTDVLSFPYNNLREDEFDPNDCEIDPETGNVLLGSMVLSVPRCESQAEEYGTGFAREISYLAVHSLLHLLGYDHLDEGERKRLMRQREKANMGKLRLLK
ncbi:MAG: rRNA maturation RNase YbeY [Oscillospiraceae bacterium]|nr:rRNA maturation RNase YbeY [Oscillospiraceae bacterium]